MPRSFILNARGSSMQQPKVAEITLSKMAKSVNVRTVQLYALTAKTASMQPVRNALKKLRFQPTASAAQAAASTSRTIRQLALTTIMAAAGFASKVRAPSLTAVWRQLNMTLQ